MPHPPLPAKILVPITAALALAACGNERERNYEADVVDNSGGELIVTEQTPAVPVTTPDTAMTPVPPGANAENDPTVRDTTIGETTTAQP